MRIKSKNRVPIFLVHAKTTLENKTPLYDENRAQKRKNILVFVVKKEEGEWICHTAQNTEIISNMETWVRDEEGGNVRGELW